MTGEVLDWQIREVKDKSEDIKRRALADASSESCLSSGVRFNIPVWGGQVTLGNLATEDS
jgi:hypothetical protein